jgi:hypothetical protein
MDRGVGAPRWRNSIMPYRIVSPDNHELPFIVHSGYDGTAADRRKRHYGVDRRQDATDNMENLSCSRRYCASL